MDVRILARKYALANAAEHNGKAAAKSVLGSVIADNPSLRDNINSLRSVVEDEVSRINKMSADKQAGELESLGRPVKRAQEEHKTAELSGARHGDFVTRFAPNPDGALHIGNARPAVLSYEYAKKYNGVFILRFDDTDPSVKVPELRFYKWIKDDLKWLGISWKKEIIASKRLSVYYKFAEELIKLGGAYVCTCDEEWKKLRDKGKPCACRSLPQKENMKRWKAMLSYKYKGREAVLRIKTDLNNSNPAVRDWAAFRIVDKPEHPLVKKHVWPLYNFASAIDDHVTNVTHILRGQEHSTNQTKQEYLYKHFGWKYPVSSVLGRFSLSHTVLSKSQIRDGIKRGIYRGWDDLQLGTLRALRRRGIQPEAIRQMIVDIGMKSSDITLSAENLSAYNRRIIDRIADRYYFVRNPVKIVIKNPPIKKAELPLHPERKTGTRKFVLSKVFYIEAEDFSQYKGMEVRLKGLYNIRLDNVSVFTTKDVKNTPKLHWVPEKHIAVKVLMPGNEVVGYGEPSLAKAKAGSLVQFERFGFCRIEKASKSAVTAVWSHE